MISRTLAIAFSALILSAGMMSAEAATHRRTARHHAPARHHAAMKAGKHTPMRGMAMRTRGRDAESGSVDQLNAQSLNAARGGAAPAMAAPQ